MRNTDFLEYQRWINEDLPKQLKEVGEIVGKLSKTFLEHKERIEKKEKDWEITVFRLYEPCLTNGYNNITLRSNGQYLNEMSEGDGYYTLKQQLDRKDMIIHTVRRLSDGVEFSVGDKQGNGKILNFEIKDKMYAVVEEANTFNPRNYEVLRAYIEIKDLSNNAHTPLFKTADGVEVFEGDNIFAVFQTYGFGYSTWLPYHWKNTTPNNWDNTVKTFSTREKAEDYILRHKPCLSYSDIEMISNDVGGGPKCTYNKTDLISITKSKIYQ